MTFDAVSQKEIADVLQKRGGANPDAVMAARKRTNTKLVRARYLVPAPEEIP